MFDSIFLSCVIAYKINQVLEKAPPWNNFSVLYNNIRKSNETIQNKWLLL